MAAYSDRVDCLAAAAAWPDRPLGDSAKISGILARSGRVEETFEWRIGSDMTQAIERIEGGFRVWSITDTGTWEALVAEEGDALVASYALNGLQQSLFYAIGWASRASAGGLEEGPRNACERYLTLLWSDGRERAGAIANEAAVAIEHGDAWEQGISRLRAVPEPYPDDPADRRMWVETQTSGPGLRFVCASPTVGRAAEFVPVYEGLANDIPRELGWRTPAGGDGEEMQ